MKKRMQRQEGEASSNAPAGAVSAYEWMSSLTVALLVVAFVFLLFFRIVGVSGDSMKDTLHDQDRLVLISQFYSVKRGDIVVINRHKEEPLIKRVVAVAGDTIEIDEQRGIVILNGTELQETFVRGGVTPAYGFQGPYTVPEGYIFAMGDNRSESNDSRQLGAFPLEHVAGKVVFRLFPLDSIGRLGNGE